MNTYEKLRKEAREQGVIVKEVVLKSKSDGLYYNGKIALNSDRLNNPKEKACILAEELGHHYTTVGNIIDLSCPENRKQEYIARAYAYNKIAGLTDLARAYKSGCRNKREIAEYLGITEKFLNEAIEYHESKYRLLAMLFGPTVAAI